MSKKAILPVVQALCDGHVLIMTSGAQTLQWLGRCNGNLHDAANLRIANEAASMANLSARLMEHQQSTYRLWLQARHLPGMNDLARAPVTRVPESAAPAKLHAAAGLARGRLNNGNPAGDYLKSPRCGARTRAGGCCRQPAMRNGRCRMHGGLSTGPRTPEGLARCRRTRLVHGFRGRPILQFRSRAVHTARRLRDLTAGLRAALRQDSRLRVTGEGRKGGVPAGHGVHRSVLAFRNGCRAVGPEIDHGAHRHRREGSVGVADSKTSYPSSVFSASSSSSVLNLAPAGHGLHRLHSISQAGAGLELALTAAGPDSIRAHLRSSVANLPLPAGHGLHRPDFIRDLSAHPRAAAC